MRLQGKVAIVTGGARGIGQAECMALAREGASVIVNDFGGGADGTGGASEPAAAVADQITANGGKAVPHFGDVSRMQTGEELVQTALNEFGQLDILINNAGILRDRMLHNMTEAEWDAVIAVHLKGTFVCTRAAATVFRDQRSGAIVNTGSESGLGNMGQANYSAAKEGIVGFTRTVARDLGRYGARCNVIRPRAATRLTLSDQLRDAVEKAKKSGDPAPDLSHIEKWVPDGVAAFAVWLCTDAAACVNGEDFVISAQEVSRMTLPSAAASAFTEDVWNIDQLDTILPQSLVRGLKNKYAPKGA